MIEVTPRGLVLKEIASDTTLEKVRAATGAALIVGHAGLLLTRRTTQNSLNSQNLTR